MRILMVSHYFDSHRGGIEIVAGRLATELAALGHEVAWAAGDVTEPPQDGIVRAIPLPVWNSVEKAAGLPMPILRASGLARLFREVRRADAVIVHDALYTTSLAALAAAKCAGKPKLLIQHIGDVPYASGVLSWAMRVANRLVVRPTLTRADQTIFISESVRAYFGALRYRRPPLVFFNGVDRRRFRPADAAERRRLRDDLGLGESAQAALFVGRFVEKKGLGSIREAARLRPEVTFLLAGWGPIDPRQWSLPNVRVLEGVSGDRVADLYRAADLLILPSVGEGLPLVLQEALSTGLPVICGEETATADGAAATWLNAIAIDLSDPVGTGERLAQAIDATPRADCIEAEARASFAQGRYSWPNIARRYSDALMALAGPAADGISPAPLEARAA